MSLWSHLVTGKYFQLGNFVVKHFGVKIIFQALKFQYLFFPIGRTFVGHFYSIPFGTPLLAPLKKC